ncbi:MAG: ClbS/DfsB family four-helix bundle protein [Chloroflexi bacterium]|nr:ClbS/DfsB family four-helix bundle protein [Chloroflexota bacterium]MDA1001734.1 ClbS/DfsB family four-helix bundle protein [Chloroflexota bacterium]
MADVIDELIEGNAQARAELIDVIDALPAERRSEGWFGPEQWSVHDIIGHLGGWQAGWSHALELMASGERPAVPGYEGDDDAYNAGSVAAARERSWEQLMVDFRQNRERHEAAVRGLRGTMDLERIVPGRTAHNLANAGGHDREHIDAIRDWRRAQGI